VEVPTLVGSLKIIEYDFALATPRVERARAPVMSKVLPFISVRTEGNASGYGQKCK
jgi:hypothetical protein